MNTFILLTAAFEWYIHILIRSSDFIAVCIILSVSPESMKLIVKKQGKVLHDIESMTSVRDFLWLDFCIFLKFTVKPTNQVVAVIVMHS